MLIASEQASRWAAEHDLSSAEFLGEDEETGAEGETVSSQDASDDETVEAALEAGRLDLLMDFRAEYYPWETLYADVYPRAPDERFDTDGDGDVDDDDEFRRAVDARDEAGTIPQTGYTEGNRRVSLHADQQGAQAHEAILAPGHLVVLAQRLDGEAEVALVRQGKHQVGVRGALTGTVPMAVEQVVVTEVVVVHEPVHPLLARLVVAQLVGQRLGAACRLHGDVHPSRISTSIPEIHPLSVRHDIDEQILA